MIIKEPYSWEQAKIQVHESCAGCGLCLKHCPQEALHVVQTGETKEHLYDYFEKTGGKW